MLSSLLSFWGHCNNKHNKPQTSPLESSSSSSSSMGTNKDNIRRNDNNGDGSPPEDLETIATATPEEINQAETPGVPPRHLSTGGAKTRSTTLAMRLSKDGENPEASSEFRAGGCDFWSIVSTNSTPQDDSAALEDPLPDSIDTSAKRKLPIRECTKKTKRPKLKPTIDDLNKTIANFEKGIKDRNKMIAKLEKEMKELSFENADIKKKMNTLEEKKNEASSENADLKKKMKTLKQKSKKASSENSYLKEKEQCLEGENMKMILENEDLKKKTRSLKENNKETYGLLLQRLGRIRDLQNEIEDQQKRLEHQNEHIVQELEEKTELESKLESVKKESDDAEQERDQFKTQVLEGEAKFADLTKVLEQEKQARERAAAMLTQVDRNTADHIAQKNREEAQAPPAAAKARSDIIELVHEVEKLKEVVNQKFQGTKESATVVQRSPEGTSPVFPNSERAPKKEKTRTYSVSKHASHSFACKKKDSISEYSCPEAWPKMFKGKAYTWKVKVTYKPGATFRLGVLPSCVNRSGNRRFRFGDRKHGYAYSEDGTRWRDGNGACLGSEASIGSGDEVTMILDLTSMAGGLKCLLKNGKVITIRSLNAHLDLNEDYFEVAATMIDSKVEFYGFREQMLDW
jgi:hypothetical protein